MPTAVSAASNEAVKGTVEGTYKSSMNHGVLLYTGYNGYIGKKFTPISDDGIDILLNTTDEVLLIPITIYNRYTDANGVEHQIITEEAINSITSDMINYPSYLSSVKQQYLEYSAKIIDANYAVEDYAADAAFTAKRLVEKNPDVKIWLSVTSSEGLHALTHLFVPAWLDLIEDLKTAVGEEIWHNNVMGIYYATEDIVTYQYTKFDTSAVDNDFNSPIVYAMHKVSDAVHAYGKEMLWIPYYHPGSPMATNLGHVVNLTNIFDTVILQPSYYFDSTKTTGLSTIRNSVLQQKVVDANGNVVGGKKTSNTKIGFEMEIDYNSFTDAEYQARYQAYVDTFKDLVGKYPTAYYAGAPDVMVNLASYMGDFFDINNEVNTKKEVKSYYSLPVNDIREWETWETDNTLANSQKLKAEVTDDGLKIGFTSSGINSTQSFHVRNAGGILRVQEGDKLIIDIETNGQADLKDLLWNVKIYFGGHDLYIPLGKYIGNANSSHQLPRGKYEVELDIVEVLKAYDTANGLSGADSAYEQVFGASGNTYLCGIYFGAYSNDINAEILIREFSFAREMDVYTAPTYTDIIKDKVNGSETMTVYSFPVGDISKWVAERTANHSSGYAWSAPLTGTNKSDEVNGEITSRGSMRLTLSGSVQCPVARIESSSGLTTVSADDYFNVDVYMEGDSTDTVRWCVQLVLDQTNLNISKYVADAAGRTVNDYKQIGAGKFKVSINLGETVKEYDRDNGTSYYSAIFADGKATVQSVWMVMCCNSPEKYTNTGLEINSLSFTTQPYFVEYEHNYKAVVTAPTCTEDGYTTYTCYCGESYVSDVVNANGHNCTSVVTAPTCTEDGYTTYTCNDCGHSYIGDTVKANGHKFGDWYTVTPATSTTKGEERRDCDICEEFETKEIPVLAESTVGYEIINGKLIITTITDSTINRVALYGADGKCIKTVNTYTVNESGMYVWTFKFAAPTEEIVYTVKARDAATNSYKNGITFPSFTVVPEVVFEKVEVDVRGDKVYVIATTVSENYDRVAVVNPVDGSYVKYTRNYKIVDGKYEWTIFFDYVEGMEDLVVKARDIRTNHYNNAQAVNIKVEAKVEPVLDVSITEYGEKQLLVTVTTIPDLYRVKIAYADDPTSHIAYARTPATKTDKAWTWQIVITKPVETTEYAVDIAYVKAYARYFTYVTYEA